MSSIIRVVPQFLYPNLLKLVLTLFCDDRHDSGPVAVSRKGPGWLWRLLHTYHRESMTIPIKNLLGLICVFCLHLEYWSLKWGPWSQTVYKPFKSTAAKNMCFDWALNRAIKCPSTMNFALWIRYLTAIYWLTPLQAKECHCIVLFSHIFFLIPCKMCLETFKK